MNETTREVRKDFFLGVFAIAATYGYFLLFAEFAFIELVRAMVPNETAIRVIMGALGAGGMVGSFAAIWGLRPDNFVNRLSWSFAACAATAGIALTAGSATALTLSAAMIGIAVGWNTVTLATGLRAILGPSRLGWGAALGTGFAYALCNVPVIFMASARVQACFSLLLTAVAAAVVRFAHPIFQKAEHPRMKATRVSAWVVGFFALVFLDCTVFFVIQHTPALRDVTWAGERRLWANALAHLLAAVSAGWFLNRGRLSGLAVTAWLCLGLSCLSLGGSAPIPGTNLVYATGVSLYSAALIYFAARDGESWIASVVFAVAGWGGSGIGIVIAQDLHHIPWVLVAVTGIILVMVFGRKSAWCVVAIGIGCVFGNNAVTNALATPRQLGSGAYFSAGHPVSAQKRV